MGRRAMSNRWFGVPSEIASARPRDSQGHPGSAAAGGSGTRLRQEEAFWRSWLSTGARRVPIDRRRARGADAHLKKILVGGPSGAVDFSSAMARQAVDEALHELPPREKQVVKLAYFGGLTNREIAKELGLSVSAVRRVLRASLASIGAHFERGRAKGRRAIQDLVMQPMWSRFGDIADRASWPSLDHVLQTGMVAAVTAAAALLVTHQGATHVGHAPGLPHASAVASAGSSALHTRDAPVVDALNQRPAAVPRGDAGVLTRNLPLLPVNAIPPLPFSVRAPAVVSNQRPPENPQLPFGA